MINKEEFLKTCNLTEDDLTAARISWEELTEIYEDYMSKTKLFRHLGKEFVDEYIYDIERAGIHSYRYRTKNPMHLLEKIIRKRKENYAKFEHINKSNYHKYITDLIGIRVFFLYREDWIHFHKFITSMFENDPNNYIEDRLRDFDEDPEHCYIAERPKVYKRSGDTRIYDSTQIAGITVHCIISSSITDTIWKSRAERFLKKDGARLTMILCIRITRMMRC